MALTPGARLGPYEITGTLGAGGMGEVYRATDTNLKRAVAIKVLPESVATDRERLARFQREAEVLASLNHPNIAAIHGLEESNGVRALIMELVEGETLADRNARGRVPIDEALPIAKQIAEALEAAHEQGIVHRDLKPANIKLRPDGTVKVLDFGLAKAIDATGSSSHAANVTNSPTVTSPAMMTGVGMLLGTAAYMSPEQARGKPVDKRSDIWAFGCVLYEMLTGKRAFEGEDVSDTLANILKADPNWTALPTTVPASIHALVRGCLEKDRRRRIGDIAAGIFALRHLASAVSPPAYLTRPAVWRRALPIVAAAFVGGAIAGTSIWRVTPTSPLPVTRFEMALDQGQQFPASAASRRLIALSPDGSQLAYVANSQIYMRSLSRLEPRPLPATQDSRGIQNPVFSPDGQSIAFYSVGDRALKRVAVSGGAVVTLCSTSAINGLTWTSDGILFSVYRQGVMRVNPIGGNPETLIDAAEGPTIVQPQLLPGGRAVLYTVADEGGVLDFDQSRIVVQVLSTGERKTLIEGGTDAWYVPTGHILYARGGVLWAVPFDLAGLEVTGGAVSIIEGVARGIGAVGLATAQYSVSDSGSLAYIPGPATASGGERTLVSIDPQGTLQPLKRQPGAYQSVRVSPDGSRLAVVLDNGKDVSIWIDDVTGESSMRRLTFEGRNRFPVWSADGQRVAFQSDRGGDLGIWWQMADGSRPAERLTTAERRTAHIPESWVPNEQAFSFSLVGSSGDVSLWIFSTPMKKAEPVQGLRSSAAFDSAISPDGRWLAYTLRAPGTAGVYVQPIPPTGAKYQVAASGHHPLWSPDGQRLLYFPGAERLTAARVTTRPAFTISQPEPVPGGMTSTTSSETGRNHDFAPDGRLFAVFLPSQLESGPTMQRISVVVNWTEELKRLVPAN